MVGHLDVPGLTDDLQLAHPGGVRPAARRLRLRRAGRDRRPGRDEGRHRLLRPCPWRCRGPVRRRGPGAVVRARRTPPRSSLSTGWRRPWPTAPSPRGPTTARSPGPAAEGRLRPTPFPPLLGTPLRAIYAVREHHSCNMGRRRSGLRRRHPPADGVDQVRAQVRRGRSGAPSPCGARVRRCAPHRTPPPPRPACPSAPPAGSPRVPRPAGPPPLGPRRGRLRDPGLQVRHPRVGRRPLVHLAREHDRRRRRPADHRRVRALDRGDLHRLVQRLENTTNAPPW